MGLTHRVSRQSLLLMLMASRWQMLVLLLPGVVGQILQPLEQRALMVRLTCSRKRLAAAVRLPLQSPVFRMGLCNTTPP